MQRNEGQEPRWRRWTAAEAQQVLEAWRSSGLPLATYARQQGFGPERLQRWKSRLLGAGTSASGSPTSTPTRRLVPAVMTAGLIPIASAAVGAITIHAPGGVLIELASAEATWVATLVRELVGPAR